MNQVYVGIWVAIHLLPIFFCFLLYLLLTCFFSDVFLLVLNGRNEMRNYEKAGGRVVGLLLSPDWLDACVLACIMIYANSTMSRVVVCMYPVQGRWYSAASNFIISRIFVQFRILNFNSVLAAAIPLEKDSGNV